MYSTMQAIRQTSQGYNWWTGDDKNSISDFSAPEDGLDDEDKRENKGCANLRWDTNQRRAEVRAKDVINCNMLPIKAELLE